MHSKSSVTLKQLVNPSKAFDLEKRFNDLQDLHKNFKAQGLFYLLKPCKHYKDIFMFKRDIGLKEGFDTTPMIEMALYTVQPI